MLSAWSSRKPVAMALAALVLFTGILTTTSMASAAAPARDVASADKVGKASEVTSGGWRTKAAATAFRYGGPFLSRVVSKVSPKAAKIIERKADRIANWLERAGNVRESGLVAFLKSIGVPTADARIVARYTILVFGL